MWLYAILLKPHNATLLQNRRIPSRYIRLGMQSGNQPTTLSVSLSLSVVHAYPTASRVFRETSEREGAPFPSESWKERTRRRQSASIAPIVGKGRGLMQQAAKAICQSMQHSRSQCNGIGLLWIAQILRWLLQWLEEWWHFRAPSLISNVAEISTYLINSIPSYEISLTEAVEGFVKTVLNKHL